MIARSGQRFRTSDADDEDPIIELLGQTNNGRWNTRILWPEPNSSLSGLGSINAADLAACIEQGWWVLVP